MKFNRRGFFGLGAGAAVAAAAPPSLGSDLSVPPYYNTVDNTMLAQEMAMQNNVKKQIDAQYLKKLTRIASGDISDEETEQLTAKGDNAYRRYLPLKSVSDAGKDYLTDRRRIADDKRNMIRQAKEVLERYDRTGFLRQVYGWYNEVERDVRGYD